MNAKILITSAVAFTLAFGAGAISFSSQADMSLAVSPESPKPGQGFKVEARSFVFDTLRANFQWLLNGKIIATGRGLAEQDFIASNLGSIMNIKAAAVSADGTAYASSASIPIADIDLIVSPLTYIPLFYRGAALATPGSAVEIAAIPFLYSGGSRLNPQNLIYEWSLNDEKLLKQSGGGKSKLTLDLPNFGVGENEVSLTVSNLNGSISVKRNTKIKTQSPEVLFYESSELTGIKQLASPIFQMAVGGKLSIIAEPFFMALESLARARIRWIADGKDLEVAPENPRLLELTAPQSSQFQSNFLFSIEDTKTLFQKAEANLTVLSNI